MTASIKDIRFIGILRTLSKLTLLPSISFIRGLFTNSRITSYQTPVLQQINSKCQINYELGEPSKFYLKTEWCKLGIDMVWSKAERHKDLVSFKWQALLLIISITISAKGWTVIILQMIYSTDMVYRDNRVDTNYFQKERISF